MSTPRRLTGLLVLTAACAAGCSGSDVPPDEALARARKDGGEYADLGKDSEPGAWAKAAYRYYPPAALDYFEDMDAVGAGEANGIRKLELSPAAVKGRNAWVIWTAGNEAWWDWVSRNGYGTIDLLKLIDSVGRESRFARSGLINEPGTRPPTEEETQAAFGVRYARPGTPEHPAARGKVHVEYRKDRGADWGPADPAVYGYPTGVVGLRLFPNPEFTSEAKDRWLKNLALYYADSDEGRRYAARPDTIRPFRVGMSCGFCHIAPHPLNPPADVENPEWANLSNNIGNQYLRVRAVFGNVLKPDNYLYHVFDSQLPGAVDTSGYPSDNNNNPNTINSVYGFPGRVARAGHNPKEVIGPDTLAYLRAYVDRDFATPTPVPRVLLDGSDSVGVHIALSRVYLNIGTHHQQWTRVQNPIIGFRKQEPFKLRDVAENSLYWHATLLRIGPMAAFFTASTDPMRLKDAPLTPEQRQKHLRGSGVPWHTDAAAPADYSKGRAAFAKGCIACHSSVQPGDLPALEAKITVASLPADRAGLRLVPDDRARLARGDGTLPPAYAQWAQEAVKHREFWEHTVPVRDADGRPVKDKDGKDRTMTVHNFLSIDDRVPVTVARTNSGRAVATNAMHGHIWEDFASETYKGLGALGPIRYRDPVSGAEKTYSPPGGGPGYYRVPTLISIWATAPFFHNNALGTFNNDPSVQGRLDAFDDAIARLLWPERRNAPSTQKYWDGQSDPRSVPDAWYPGKRNGDAAYQSGVATPTQKAAQQREADGGWVWRTHQECWVQFDGAHVPMLVGGAVGQSAQRMRVLAWLPAVVFVALAVLLLLANSLIAWRERKLGWLEWVLAPVRWVIVVGSVLLAVAAVVALFRYWAWIDFLDATTRSSIWGFRAAAILAPVVFFGSVALLFSLSRWKPDGGVRRRLPQAVGGLCLLVAALLALGLGRFLSGRGEGIRLGPIPEGAPVNLLANVNPDAPPDQMLASVKALMEYTRRHPTPKEGEEEKRRADFEANVAPALLNASKCPDFVTDRGHDFEFIRRMTDEEKRELIALLKTF